MDARQAGLARIWVKPANRESRVECCSFPGAESVHNYLGTGTGHVRGPVQFWACAGDSICGSWNPAPQRSCRWAVDRESSQWPRAERSRRHDVAMKLNSDPAVDPSCEPSPLPYFQSKAQPLLTVCEWLQRDIAFWAEVDPLAVRW